MIDKETFNGLLGIKENFEMPTRLLGILSNKERREALFTEVLKYTDDLSIDALRDYFQSENGDRKSLKQDYTPDCVCEIISRLSENVPAVYDMCAGSGALTIAKWGGGKDTTFYCDEFSANVLPVLLLNLAIRNVNAVVRQCDVLTKEVAAVWRLTRGERFSDIERVSDEGDKRVGLVITNLPYSLPFKDVERFADDERFRGYALPPKSKADYAFVLNGLSMLDDNGEMFAVLPHGILFRGNREGEIRKKLVENNLIDAVIGLPNNMFMNTGIPVFILVLKKNRKVRDVLFIDASKDYVKHGKQNEMTAEHIEKLVSVCKNRLTCEKYSRTVEFEEIKGNEFNLNIPRYVDTAEKEPLPDIGELMTDLMKTEGEIARIKREIVGAMGDMVCTGEDSAEFYGSVEKLKRYQDFDKKSLYDVGRVERMKNGEIYPAGTIMIELSATKGVVKYCEHPTEGDGRYAAVVVDERYNAYYIYQSILNVFGEFIAKYKTTINLQFDALRHLRFHVHRERATQDSIAAELMLREAELKREEHQIEIWQDVEKYFLNVMFAGLEERFAR